ncbi:MAG: penicillin-binding protein 2 [Acetatifactor sp.]|nr:penicillin-binding protein 2 [Acetatifactor sp.]
MREQVRERIPVRGRQSRGGHRQEKKFGSRMQKKLVVLFILVLLAFAGLSLQLIRIAREKEDEYTRQILSQQRYDSTTIPFRRGDIVDARGTQLAVSENVYNVILDIKVIRDKEKLEKKDYMEPTLQALDRYFDLDMSAVRSYVTTHEKSAYYVLARRLPYEQISEFQAAMDAEGSMIRGVWFEKEYKRYYPMGTLACDVIGFTSSDNVGAYGLEAYYNEELNGTTGREFGYLNNDSTLERTIKPAEDGYTIHSTIDANIQSIVEKYLKLFDDEHRDAARIGNGAENVGCIIMEIDTGEILAMASYPNYDLNDTRNTDALIGNVMVDDKGNKTKQYITAESIAQMDDTTLYMNLNYLWKNYCISDTYEPGSTFKPFTTAMGLEVGALAGNEVYECSGFLESGGYKIRCHNTWGDGSVSLEDAIAWSCNVALMKEAQTIGIDRFAQFQQAFNFGLRTNIDLEGETRTASLILGADRMTQTDLYTYSFGQGFNVTMIEMITGFCSLINGGYYYEPHIVDRITNANGATVENIEPRVLRQVISESTSERIRQYCEAVVMRQNDNRITGRTARPAGYAIGGKTGTAQTFDRETGLRSKTEHVVSFIGYAPADDPQIAIYVVVDRANAAEQDQARFATGIVRNVLTEVLPYLNIYMTEELSEAEIQELQERQLAITSQYTQTPEDEDLEDIQEQEPEPTAGPGNITRPAWMDFPIDPSTGHRVDPATNEHYDPDTGDAIGGTWQPLD